jgi:hypothetical protein
MSHVTNSGLSLTLPDLDETGWYTLMEAVWLAISAHNHDSSNDQGAQVGTAGIAVNAVTDAILRLRNNQNLRARNAADSADINVALVDTSNRVTFPTVSAFTSTETLTSAGAISVSTQKTILNGAGAIAMTLANGTEGQFKLIVNIGAAGATVTPATTAGTNTATLAANAAVMYWFLSGEWRAFPGSGGAVIA